MNRKELRDNLGTIAKSGTQSFLEAVAKGADVNLIGQFGVGFYSSFLVADRVTVITKHNDDTQHIWESDASETFTIREDPEGNTLGRGTKIILHMKEDEAGYVSTDKIKDLAARYSEYIDTPVYVKVKKTEKVPAPEEPEAPEHPEEAAMDEEEVKMTEEAKEEKPKEIERVYYEYEHINPNKPIWMRNPKEITDEEYTNFYKSLTKETVSPLAHIHFKGESGEVNFRAILYTPETAPFNAFEFVEKNKHIKLFVRRVLIADEFEDFLPRYLNFVRGVVDSDDLPLNVSREMLQESHLLKTIAKRLVRKIIEMFNNIAKRDDPEDYRKFWRVFGKNIKVGILEDTANKLRLSKLLRYESTKSDGELISLDTYIERLPKGQDDIFYIAGENVAAIRNSPFLDSARRRGVEVLYFTDPLDEYMATSMSKYENHKFVSVTKEGITFGEETEDIKERTKQLRETFEPLIEWLKTALGDKVERVTVSHRLRDPAEPPCVLANTASTFSANMERIIRAQATIDERVTPQYAKKVLELNPAHPLVRGLLKLAKNAPAEGTPEHAQMASSVDLLFDTAMMDAGFLMEDVPTFTRHVYNMLLHATALPAPEPQDDVDLAPAPEPAPLPPRDPEEDKPLIVDETETPAPEAPQDDPHLNL